jgi:acyl-CoA dehydrogenase
LESAWLSILQAASWHDAGRDNIVVGKVANMAKYVAVEAAIEACYHAMQTFGGAGFAAEYHVERWWREVQLFRLAPLTQQMSLNFIGEHVLGMPKSY